MPTALFIRSRYLEALLAFCSTKSIPRFLFRLMEANDVRRTGRKTNKIEIMLASADGTAKRKLTTMSALGYGKLCCRLVTRWKKNCSPQQDGERSPWAPGFSHRN